MIMRILSVNGVNEAIPNFSLHMTEKMNYDRVIDAYEVLSSSYNGVRDFISVLEMIAEGKFNLTEAVLAGLLLTESLDGRFYSRRKIYKAKYLKINGINCIYLVETKELFSSLYHEKGIFCTEDGTEYVILPDKKR